jgi:hypothetical protein
MFPLPVYGEGAGGGVTISPLIFNLHYRVATTDISDGFNG